MAIRVYESVLIIMNAHLGAILEDAYIKVCSKNTDFNVLPLQGVICISLIYPRRCHWAEFVYALSGQFLEVAF